VTLDQHKQVAGWNENWMDYVCWSMVWLTTALHYCKPPNTSGQEVSSCYHV